MPTRPAPPRRAAAPASRPASAGRRRILGTGLALGGLGGLAAVSGCAAPALRTGPAALGRVVVVGGGFGGGSAAHHLRQAGADIEVTLVEREPEFVSCPMSNLVVGGLQPMASITRSYRGLQAAGVRLVRGEAVAVDTAARRVRLAGGMELPYDRLILAPGIDFIVDDIPGLGAALADGRAVHAWQAGAQTLALRRRLEALPAGGVVAIAVPLAPYRCPPAPYERACLVASFLRAHKPRAKLLLLDANPEIQSKKALFERAFAERHAGVLEYRPNSELREVADGVLRFDFEDVKADVLNVVPPQRAASLARRTGLVTVNDRWVGVDWLTMESAAMPGVHVLGDAVFPAPLMAKSAQMANQHARLAAAAVRRLLRGERVDDAPLLANTCYSFVDPGHAMHISSVHRYDAAAKTFEPVPGAGSLSVAASAAEVGDAARWAENLWADTLAL